MSNVKKLVGLLRQDVGVSILKVLLVIGSTYITVSWLFMGTVVFEYSIYQNT